MELAHIKLIEGCHNVEFGILNTEVHMNQDFILCFIFFFYNGVYSFFEMYISIVYYFLNVDVSLGLPETSVTNFDCLL
jgi:hypothetical protein